MLNDSDKAGGRLYPERKLTYALALFLCLPFIAVGGSDPARDNLPGQHAEDLSDRTPLPTGRLQDPQLLDKWVSTMEQLTAPETSQAISHLGHPQFGHLAFLYDTAVNALILHAAGKKDMAHASLDYYHNLLSQPDLLKTTRDQSDANGVWGILKLFESIRNSTEEVVGVVNAIDVHADPPQGRATMDYYLTPGPLSWLLFAMARVDQDRYAESILKIAVVLQAMQDADGGVRDGDRVLYAVHTEPHIDAVCALLIASRVAKNNPPVARRAGVNPKALQEDAENGWTWFKTTVFEPKNGVVHQGMREGGLSEIFATDCYTWLFASPLADRIVQEYGIKALQRLSLTLLHKGMVKISWVAPDRTRRDQFLFDFTDPNGPDVSRPVANNPTHQDYGISRGYRYHPMGSPEWTGGAILGFQMNAIRAQKAGDEEMATWFKDLAEALTQESMKSYYTVGSIYIGPYATAQNLAVGHNWRTPLFFVTDQNNTSVIEGGSLVSGWPILPMNGLNPFYMTCDYIDEYEKIPYSGVEVATEVLAKELRNEPYVQEEVTRVDQTIPTIVEPGAFNARGWVAMEKKDYLTAIKWATKVVDEQTWVHLAREQNELKYRETFSEGTGRLFHYPWGTTHPENVHPIHQAVWRYPLLNEVAAAMWMLAAAHYQLGNENTAAYWIERILEDVPLHQIANVDGKKQINGYWNAIDSWVTKVSALDRALAKLIKKKKIKLERMPRLTYQGENLIDGDKTPDSFAAYWN